MAHKYSNYIKNYVKAAQQEEDKLAKLPEAPHTIIIPDNDATEQEIEALLHGELDEDDM